MFDSNFPKDITDVVSLDGFSALDHPTDEADEMMRIWQEIVDVLPAGVVVLDPSGHIRQVNQAAIDMLEEPLVGEQWTTIIQRAFSPRDDDGYEVSLADGRRVSISLQPLQQGQLILLTDVTQSRMLQDKISHLQRLSSLGNMVASLAHQVRTPLSAAMLYASNLNNQRITESARERFQSKLVERLHALEQQVNDMLLFAKSGTEQVLESVSLQSLLSQVCADAEAGVKQYEGELRISVPDEEVMLCVNQVAVSGALQNLIQNSLHAVENTPVIRIQTELMADRVIISVIDNGVGIPQSMHDKVFEPFYTSKSHGTGLGLAVVRTVATAHQGGVRICPEQKFGTKMQFWLPIEDTQEDVA
ncbi:sensor histidine kinase [Algicola sagamiensis]|uniref:sensor histidine kinase n=1 Tax=Algicola sagamiensis TaxID=163869 RepID=UPI0003A4E9FD|nr:ATP-binding protein [Algicola sagamiensis]